MTYEDDEPIVAILDDSGDKPEPFETGKIQVTITNRPEAPLKETELKVLLELTGSGDIEDRNPVDLVMVLDVSESMNNEDRIERLKIAVQFLIQKLCPNDRLSVVTFSKDSTRLFPLRQITSESQLEIIEKVNALEAHGATNMAAGLKMGLQILNDRRLNNRRVGAIMLMSDGDQSIRYQDARQVPDVNFAVYTFGFGLDTKQEVLEDIAKKSMGGMFSEIGNQNDLSKAFSQCLGGLLDVVVQDLKLTLTQIDNESNIDIDNVTTGSYPKIQNNGSVSILLGELYYNEVRKVLLNLLLLEADGEKSPDVLHVNYSYRCKDKRLFEAPPVIATVTRSMTATDKEISKLIIEENRLKTLNSLKEARVMAYNSRSLSSSFDFSTPRNNYHIIGRSYGNYPLLKSKLNSHTFRKVGSTPLIQRVGYALHRFLSTTIKSGFVP